MAALGLINFQSNDDLRKQELLLAQQRQAQPVILGLAAYINRLWDAAKYARTVIESQMLKNLRQRDGMYEPEVLAAIRQQGGSEIYMMLTEVKCRAAESWLRDILLDSGAPPWDLKPTSLPDLPPDIAERIAREITNDVLLTIQQMGVSPTPEQLEEMRIELANKYSKEATEEAEDRSKRMKRRIEDQLQDGGWMDGFHQFISDLVTYPAAFFKGPIPRKRKELDWIADNATGKYVPQVVEKIIPTWERVDPFRIFPEPGVTKLNDGYLFEHHRLSADDLYSLIGLPGYDEGSIRYILDSAPSGVGTFDNSLLTIELQKSLLERKDNIWMNPTAVYDALQFWGKVPGRLLVEWGTSPQEVPDIDASYDVEAWIVGNTVIKAVLNYDPLGCKPYYKTSFIKVPGAFWGRGIPEVIADIQQMCNASARALANNMGLASGPQVVYNIDRLPSGEKLTQMFPWKIWQATSDPLGSTAPAISFEQPSSNADVLMTVYERFSKIADDHSGIPAYIYGDTDVSGAGRTASGLSMLMGSAGKGIRQVIMYIDNDVIRPSIKKQYLYNMQFDEDETIKGDCEILALGVSILATREQLNVRRVEFLTATANPMDAQIVGIKGRAAILREVVRGLDMPEDEIIPSEEELEALMAQQQQAQTEQMMLERDQEGNITGASIHPGGQTKGGQEGNTVMNRNTGRS